MPDATKKRLLAEVLALWGAALAAIALTRALFPSGSHAKLVATLFFLYGPVLVLRRRGEELGSYGFTSAGLRQGIGLGLGVSAAILPLFALLFGCFYLLLPELPEWLVRLLPYRGVGGAAPRLPEGFHLWILDQFLVVALPEELFYRGYMQGRLRQLWPQGRRFMGATLGAAFWSTQALFALGHLADPRPFRLAVFFPSIIFGLLRERSGTIVPSTIFHALSNLALLVLEASFFGT